MGFYTLFCDHYDKLFPPHPEAMRWLNAQFGDRKTLLDLGCGTGNKTVCIAGDARQALGIDADAGMIDAAQRRHAAPNIHYRVMRMQDLPESVPPDNFEAVMCLGNTIPHLASEGEVYRTMQIIRRILKKGGLFIGQMLNYDRIITMNITALPVIETDDVVFRRRYDWREGVMYFQAEIEDKASGYIQTDATPLMPIMENRFERVLRDVGFGPVDVFGTLDGQPYSLESYHLVFTAGLQ